MLRNVMHLLILLILFTASANTYSASVTLADIGMISVKASPYNAKGDGVTDDTAAIQAAIAEARRPLSNGNKRAVFFPAGTYLVSDKLKCHIRGEDSSPREGLQLMPNDDAIDLIGSTAGAKPTIKLKNNASGYGSASNPKPVIEYQLFIDQNSNGYWDSGEPQESANLQSQGIRNLRVEIGSGNPGAVALDFDGSQGCFIEDFEADLTASGYCGLNGLPGQRCVVANIKVTGGKYGLEVNKTKYPGIAGLQLINQTDAAIKNTGQQALQIAGFKIQKAEAPAIITSNTSSTGTAHLSLVDGTIEFTSANGDYAIDNVNGARTVVMRNVYLYKASEVVKSGTQPSVPGTPNGWTKVEEYVFPCKTTGRNLVNGSTNTTEYKTVTTGYGGSVPSDLVSRHIWDTADWPSPDVIMANANAGVPNYAVLSPSLRNGSMELIKKDASGNTIGNDDPDAWSALQNLIDNNRFVLIPEGKFMISKTIDLRENTVLIGAKSNASALCSHTSWLPTKSQYLNDQTALIRTPDSATAKPKMGMLQLYMGSFVTGDDATDGAKDNDWHVASLWRSGEQSMTRCVRSRIRQDSSGATEYSGNARADIVFKGNAGGRHYATGIGNFSRCTNTAHRRMLVEKSSDLALIFYNLNLEDGQGKDYSTKKEINGVQATVKNSQNVAIYSSKNEQNPLIEFLNSDNCAIFGAQGNSSFKYGVSGTTAQDCNDVYAACFAPKHPTAIAIDEYYNNNRTTLSNSYDLGVYKRGNCNFADLAIPTASIPDSPAGAPSAPTGLVATADNVNGEIDLDWNNNSEADLAFYRVYRSSASNGTYTAIGAPGASSFSDNSDEARSGQTWYYKVTAIDTNDQESTLSASDSANLNDTLPPAAPVQTTPVAGNQQVTLDWNDVTDASSYRIYYSTVTNGQVWGSYQTTSSASDKTVTGLTNGVKYYFKVTAVDASSNESSFSNQQNATPISVTPPDPPTNLAATPGDNQVSLDWDGNGTSYQVYRSDIPGDLGDEIATPTSSDYLDTGLLNGLTYYYAVKTVDANGTSAPCAAVQAVPADTVAPNAPANLSGNAGDESVSLNWDDNTDGDLAGYDVYRQFGADPEYYKVNELLLSDSEYLDVDVENGTDYYYIVYAVDDDGLESTESEAGPLTPADGTAPAAPTGLSASAGEGQIQLTWNANAEADVAGYNVYRATVSGGPYTLLESVTVPTYLDTDLSMTTTYYYVVRAFDEVPNESASSSQVSALPNVAPATPTGLGATAGDTQIVLNWEDNTEGDLADYKVYRSTTSGSYGASIATVTSSNYTATGLTNGVTYYFKVTARDTAQLESDKSSEVSAVPVDVLAPAAPTGLMATAGDTEVELVWNANGESDLTDYRVYRSTTSGSYGSAIATVSSPTYTDTNLTNGTTYFYVVTARDEVPNESAYSSEASATPQGTGGGGGSTNFTPTDDVFCRSDSASTNYNSQPYIRMRESTADYYGFSKFNVTGISGTIESVILHVKSTSDSVTGGTLNAKAVSNTTWTEGALTWNNKPAYGSTIDTVTVGAINSWYELDVTSYVTGNGTYSIGLYVSNNKDTRVHSKEASSGDRPYLVVTTAGGGDTTAPATPSGLSATAGDTQVVLNWNDNSEDDLSHYNVKRSTTSGGPYTTIANVSQSAYTDTGRTNGTTYYYVISAEDETGNESANCTQQSATPADTTAPAVPTGLTATAGNGQIVLDWADNSDADLTDYRVYRSTTSGSYGSALATVTASAHTDSTVTNGVTYYYKVTARDEVPNESAKSSEVSARPVGVDSTTTFAPAADTFARSDSASTNYGTEVFMRMQDASYDCYGFMKFTVTGISGTISSVKLKVKSDGSAVVPFNINAKAVSDTTWTESGLTWSNKPAYGSTLSTVSVNQNNTWYEMDVSSHVTGNGTFSIGLYNSSTNNGRIYTKEATNSTDRPYLEVVCSGGSSSALQVVKGSVSNVGSASWTTVTLSKTFTSPVVVCTTNYTSADAPAVVRVRNASGNKFDVKMQNPSGTSLSGMTVQYVVVEEGVYTSAVDGVKMEAKKVTSTVTDGYTNGWLGQTVSTDNNYTTPVVLGQVMTANNTAWSQFWCSDESDVKLPPTNGAFVVGKHIGEDTVLTRSNETIGYIVIEAGAGTMDSLDFLAGRSDDIVRGMGNTPPYAVSLSGLSSASNAVVTENAMEGDNGGWAVGYGSSWFSSTNLNLACDEDQITDTERAHATAPVGYIVFE